MDVDLRFSYKAKYNLIAEKQNVGNKPDKVIQFPQPKKSKFESMLADYLEKVLEGDSPLTEEASAQFWQELESIPSDKHATES